MGWVDHSFDIVLDNKSYNGWKNALISNHSAQLIPEMHRTQSDFDDNLTFKVFIFQFINFYSSIIYIAFFKGKFVGYPGAYINIVGNLRNEDVSIESENR